MPLDILYTYKYTKALHSAVQYVPVAISLRNLALCYTLRLIEPIEFIPRVGGLGLGATPRVPPPDPRRRIKKPGEEEKKTQGPFVGKDGRVKYYKKVGEEIPDQPLQGFECLQYTPMHL